MGIAIFSNRLKLKQSKALYLAGMASCCAGVYFLTEALAGQIWKINIGLHTTATVLSILLYVFFGQALIQSWFVKPMQLKGARLVLISGIGTALFLSIVILTDRKMYDILPMWAIFQSVLCTVQIAYCFKNLRYLERHMAKVQILFLDKKLRDKFIYNSELFA